MRSTSTSKDAPASDLPRAVPSRRVTDTPTLVFHWLFASSFAGAYLTAESEHWRLVHVTLGYTFAGLFVFRLLWGVIGPRHASLGNMLRKLGAWRTALDGLRAGRPNWLLTQHLARAAATLTLLLLVIPVTLSGYASYADWPMEWLGESHEFFSNLQLNLVLTHIGLIVLLSFMRRSNHALPMLTGRAGGPGPDLVRRKHRLVAVLLMVAVAGFWLMQWDDAHQAPATAATSAPVGNPAAMSTASFTPSGEGLLTLLPRVLERVTGSDPERSERPDRDDD